MRSIFDGFFRNNEKNREAPVRFGYGLGMERFKRFRFSVPAVPLQKGFSVFQYNLTGKEKVLKRAKEKVFSGKKNSLNIKFLGGIFLGHPGPRRRDIPDKNFMRVAFFCCFKHGVAGMSRDLGRDVPDLEKLYAKKLWVDFSYPIFGPDLLRTYPRVIRADVLGQKLRAGPRDLGKTSIWVRTSMTRTRGRP